MVLTVKDAAAREKVSPSLVYAWVSEGRLRHKRVGRKGKRGGIRIDSRDLDALMEECEGEGAETPRAPYVFKHVSLN